MIPSPCCLGNPFLELAGVLITSIIQMEDENLSGMFGVEFLEEFDDVGVGNGAAGLTHIDIFAIRWDSRHPGC